MYHFTKSQCQQIEKKTSTFFTDKNLHHNQMKIKDNQRGKNKTSEGKGGTLANILHYEIVPERETERKFAHV